MVRQAIEIMKVRWPEVMLVVVLQAALMIFTDELMRMSEAMATDQSAQMAFWSQFFLGLGSILVVTVWMMLYLGFLKTAATGGAYPQQPREMVRIGRPYFWKMLLFQLLFGIVLVVLSSAVVAVLGGIIWRTQDFSKIPEWFSQLCVLATAVILIKPLLFIPARIVVYDDSLIQATTAVQLYRLTDIDGLVGLTAGGFSAIGVFLMLSHLAAEETFGYYILSGLHHLIFSGVLLWLTLAVVLRLQKQLDLQQGEREKGVSQE